MKNLQNLHTHSTYCDGKNSLEEMVLSAISKGFQGIGFSGHSYMPFASHISMSLEGTEEYKREIGALKEKYAGKIDIFCGVEVEAYSQIDLSGYDYLIGSCHYFKIDNEYVAFDRRAQFVKEVIDNYFDGNGLKYAKAYYELLSTLPSFGSFDIIGHFDVITKHVEANNFFDANSKEYLSYAFDAVDALKGKIPLFEVNTGAIARGYRTAPYPSRPILKRLLEKGFKPVISSDCHNSDYLDCGFELSEKLLKACGATERYILTKDGFKGVKID